MLREMPERFRTKSRVGRGNRDAKTVLTRRGKPMSSKRPTKTKNYITDHLAGTPMTPGAFSTPPVVPGLERPADWEAHRAGILDSLAPAGLLETRLAERVALLLWRLD